MQAPLQQGNFMFNYIHPLKKSTFLACLAFFCISNHAMEDDIELQPLLKSWDTDSEETSGTFSFEAFKKFSDENPEVTAHIFSFLPENDSCLNFLMRLDGFQPTTDPHEASPYYPVAKAITSAHSHYIF